MNSIINRSLPFWLLSSTISRLACTFVLLVSLTTIAWSEITGAISFINVPGYGYGTWVKRSQLASDDSLFVAYNGYNGGGSGISRVDFATGSVLFNTPTGGIEDIAVGVDDVLYVSGYTHLTAYKPDGTKIWEKQIVSGQGFSRGVDTDAAGNIYVSYTSYYPSVTNNSAILKYDATGNLLWRKDFSLDVYQGGAQNDSGIFYLEVGQDGFIYAGFADWVRGHYIVKLDLNGNVIWNSEFGSPQFGQSEYIWEIRQEPSGIIYALGRAYDVGHVAAYQADGTLLWSKVISDVGLTSIAQSPDGPLVVSTDNGGSVVTLRGLDQNSGETLWDNPIQSNGNLIGGWLEITAQGNLIFVSSAYDGSATQVLGFPVSASNLVMQFDPVGQLSGTPVNDNMLGGTTNDQLSGAVGNDSIVGGSGNDILNGGVGSDTLNGGQGADIASYDGSAAGVAIDLSNGTTSGGNAVGDTLVSIESLEGSALGDTLTGDAGANQLIGGDGVDTLNGEPLAAASMSRSAVTLATTSSDDRLVGGKGNDTIRGGAGNDTAVYSGNFSGYTITYNSATQTFTLTDKTANRDGTDTVREVENFQFADITRTAASLTVNVINGTSSANTLNGTAGVDEIFGLGGNDTLNGAGGDDLLDGGTGGDTMNGGDGNDTYVVDSTSDVVTEGSGANGGNDTVRTTLASYTLPANVENVIYIGTGTFTGTGNSLVNSMTGGAGGDSLSGSSAADLMIGGGGNDSYTFDANGDMAVEGVNAGTDSVTASVTVTLADNVENLTLTGSSNLSGTGNSLSNSLTGNSGVNTLTGGGGSDTLNGGTGGDGMYGGEGDDNYTVDNAADITGEDAGKGTDRVSSSITRTLADHLEDLTLTGSSAINGTGNSLNNRIVGNTGANILSGAAGIDTLIGNAGNDIFYGNTSSTVGTEIDTVSYEGTTAAVTFNLGLTTAQATGGSGSDRVPNGSIENLIGGSAADTLTGTTGANRLEGAAGSDKLNGLTGADVLVGNAGLDTIDCGSETTNAIDTVVYQLLGDSAVGTNRDQILNFKTGDKIDLSAIDASTSAANDQAFTFNTTTAKANSIWFAVSGSDVIVRGDVNGNTTADFEILVKGMTSITAAAFVM